MDEIHNKVRQAQRRLWLNRWLSQLGWTLAAGAGLFVLLVVVVRVGGLTDAEGRLLARAALGLAGAALITSIVWTLLTREGRALAAARLDEAARLKERLSTALHFAESDDAFARAAVADAGRVSRLVTPRMYLPLKMPTSARYAGGSFAAALLCFWLVPAVDLSGKQAAREAEATRREQLQQAKIEVKPVVDRLEEMQARHPELARTRPAEPLRMASPADPADVKRDVVKQINDAAEKLEKQRDSDQLAKVDELKRMLRRLAAEPEPSSPQVSELSKALSRGDFNKAQKTLEALRKQLNSSQLSPQQADQLRADLARLGEQMGRIAENNHRLNEQLRQCNLSEQEIKRLLDKIRQGKLDEATQQLCDKGLSRRQAEQLVQQACRACEAQREAGKMCQSLCRAAQCRANPGARSRPAGMVAAGQGQRGQGQQGQQGRSGQSGQRGNNGGGQGQGSAGGQAGGESAGSGHTDTQLDPSAEGLAEVAEQLSRLSSLQQQSAEIDASMAELENLRESVAQSSIRGGGDLRLDGPDLGQLAPAAGAPGGSRLITAPQQGTVRPDGGAILDTRFTDGGQYAGEVSSEFVEAVVGARNEVAEAERTKPQPRHIRRRQAEYFKHVDADLPQSKLDAARQSDQAEAN